jgi:hypothetical protein
MKLLCHVEHVTQPTTRATMPALRMALPTASEVAYHIAHHPEWTIIATMLLLAVLSWQETTRKST